LSRQSAACRDLAHSSLAALVEPAIFCGAGQTMNVARAILAFLIAVSLAAVPAAAHAGMAVKPMHASAMDHMAAEDMSAMDDMDCCPHKTDTSHKMVDDCAAMAGCVLCTGFLGAAPSSLNFPLLLATRAYSSPSDPLPSLAGSPPFRPPRI
jgi:hypothetical protein